VAPSIRKKLAITSPTSGGRSVGVVRSRTQAMEFFLIYLVKIAVSSPDYVQTFSLRDLLSYAYFICLDVSLLQA
jgi:hypothetical protein